MDEIEEEMQECMQQSRALLITHDLGYKFILKINR
jgi:hypothetical protein